MEVKLRHFEKNESTREFYILDIENDNGRISIFLDEEKARQIAKQIYDVLEGGE